MHTSGASDSEGVDARVRHRLGDDAAAVIEDEGARRGGALVEGEDEFLVHGAGVGAGWGVEAGPKVTPAAIKN